MPIHFVTATGTEVGKTFVTCLLCRQLRAQGRSVRALKPVMSGYDPADAAASDAGLILKALGRAADPAAVAAVSPWRFRAPLSPDMAAAREGRSIDFEALVGFCSPGDEDVLLVEGVGGAMVPLTGNRTVLDWMAALAAPALVVAGSYLGTISHTLTTVAAMRARGVTTTAVIVSETPASTVPLDETAATIARFLPEIAVVALPRSNRPAAAPDLTRLVFAAAAAEGP